LRFLNPAIVAPDKMVQNVTQEKRRNLILISKVLQNLANGFQFGEKEAYMKITNPFIDANLVVVDSFLEEVSLPLQITGIGHHSQITPDEVTNALNHIYRQLFNDALKIKDILARVQSKSQMSAQLVLEEFNFVLGDLGNPPMLEPRSRTTTVSSINNEDTAHDALYGEYLRKAKAIDFSEIVLLKAIYTSGVDKLGRPIVIFILERIPVKQIDMEKLFLYIINIMDPIVTKEYVLIFFQSALDADHRPSFSWLRNAYSVFNRKYKKNLKELHIVKPTRWLKFVAACFRPFISEKFWKKLYYVESLNDLYAHFTDVRLNLPDDVANKY